MAPQYGGTCNGARSGRFCLLYLKMDHDFRLPEYLSLQGNPAENWRRWRQRFELYLTAKEADKKSDATKIAMLLSAIGPEAL